MASTSSTPKPVLLEEPGSRVTRQLDGTGLTIAIISTRWYEKDVVHPLVEACKAELQSKGVASDHIKCLQVPGAYELPFAASRMIHAKKQHLDAVICIGCMVKGATMAYEFVSEATAMGLMKLNVKTETPVVCGLLACHSAEEAHKCAKSMGACVVGSDSNKRCNHGVSWAQEAIELAQLKRATAQLIQKKCACACHCEQQNCTCACHCKQCKCGACTCKEGSCKCSSCFSHEGEMPAKSKMEKQFDQALAGSTGPTGASCAGCGKASDQCKCESTKASVASCGGCTKPGCVECSGQARAGGYHGRSSAPLKGEPNSETLP